MSRINWYTVIAVMCFIGGIIVAAEIWINGAENYSSATRRSDSFERMITAIAGVIGSKATAVLVAALLAVASFVIYKLGRLRRQ